MHIEDLQDALREGAMAMSPTRVSASDVRRRAAAQRARGLSLFTALLLVVGLVGAVAVNPRPHGTDVTKLVAAMGEAGSARFAITSTFKFGERTGTTSGDGIADFANGRFSLSSRLEIGPREATKIEQRVITIERDSWSSIPDDERQRFAIEAFWVHRQLTENQQRRGFLGSSQFDPSDAIKMVDDFSERVDEEGHEEVRGVSTTRYNLVIDYAWIAGQSIDSDGTTSTTASAEELQKHATYEMKIWVDDQGRLRRFDTTVRSRDEGSKESETFDSTSRMELFDFGVDTSSIQPPPANTVIEEDEYTKATTVHESSGSGSYAPVPGDEGSSDNNCQSPKRSSKRNADGSVVETYGCSIGGSIQ